MKFTCEDKTIKANFAHLVVAGWTGRDHAAVQHHIDELAELGVAPPSTVPLFYRCAPFLMTQATRVPFLGTESSGEAEPLVAIIDGQRYLGLASDHTDRKLEAVSVAASKQICAKPIAAELWRWEDISGHLDEITVTSEIVENGDWHPYQRGTLAAIRPLEDLIAASDLRNLAQSGDAAMLCGTFAAIGGVRPAEKMRMRIHDPVRDRSISRGYEAEILEVVA